MKIIFVIILSLGSATAALSQVVDTPETLDLTALSFEMDTEIGLLSIDNSDGDGERYLSSVFAPVFSKGILSAGLRLRYRWNQNGVRDEDYDELADFMAMLRFLQYSEKDAVGSYIRVGDLDLAQIGYGQFVNKYRNTLSLDTPETGVLADYSTPALKFEGLFSNIISPEVYAFRGSFSPFLSDIGSKRQNMSFGFTLAGDLSEDARLVNSQRNAKAFVRDEAPLGADTLGIGSTEQLSPLTMIAFDVGLPIKSSRFDQVEAYAEMGNILGFGSGLGIGIQADKKRDHIEWKGWFEQRLLGREYLPSYFNSRYEVDRIRKTTVTLADDSQIEAIQTKRSLLRDRDKVEFGSFGGMEIRFTRHYRLRWSLEHSWSRKGSGWFEIDFRVTDPTLPFQFRFVFDRVNMDSLNDIIFGANENGLVRMEMAYLFKKHLLMGFRYRQSFENIESLGGIVGQKKRTRIEPALIIHI